MQIFFLARDWLKRKKLAVRQSESKIKNEFQNKTSPQSAVSSGSEQQQASEQAKKMSKHLRNEVIEKIWMNKNCGD